MFWKYLKIKAHAISHWRTILRTWAASSFLQNFRQICLPLNAARQMALIARIPTRTATTTIFVFGSILNFVLQKFQLFREDSNCSEKLLFLKLFLRFGISSLSFSRSKAALVKIVMSEPRRRLTFGKRNRRRHRTVAALAINFKRADKN